MFEKFKKKSRGGKRPGSGRPAKPKPKPTGRIYESAEAYLEAVVEGSEPSDPARIRAATTLIRYQLAQKRCPKPSPSSKKMVENEQRAEESAIQDDWEQKAAEIRKRFATTKGEKNGQTFD